MALDRWTHSRCFLPPILRAMGIQYVELQATKSLSPLRDRKEQREEATPLLRKEDTMEDWNVIVTVREGGYKRAFKVLEEFGPVNRTGFFNVLVMKAGNVPRMMETLRDWSLQGSDILSILSRVVPANHTFSFQAPEEFQARAREIVLSWAPDLAGKEFHVRMHRRGFKGRLSTADEERLLDEVVLEALEKAGNPGRINFSNPDLVVAVETVGQQAGLSLWTREELERYPFLGLVNTHRPAEVSQRGATNPPSAQAP